MAELNPIHKVIADFKSGMNKRIVSWDKIIKTKEEEIKALKEKESSLLEQRNNELKRIQDIHNRIDKLESEEVDLLENEGVLKKLLILNDQIKEVKSQHRVHTTILPDCLVCLETCDPSQGRLVFCCPEGHTICGKCGDKVTKCPTCSWDKSSFGGVFARVREFEKLAGKMVIYNDGMDLLEKIGKLVVDRAPFDERREEVEKEFEEKKAPFLKELEEANEKLSSIKNEIEVTKNEHDVVRDDQISFAEMLQSHMSQIEDIARNVDSCKEASNKGTRFHKCTCELSCPHPLIIENGKIVGDPCGCVKERPCLCVTHSISMDMSIEGGSSGSIKMNLAGRTNPHAVNRFFRASRENHFAELIIDSVIKDLFMSGGYFKEDGMKKSFSFNSDEIVLDSLNKHLIEGRSLTVGYCDGEKVLRRPTFCVLLKETEDSWFQTWFRNVGEVVEGFELLNEINLLPVKSTEKNGTTFPFFPKQLVTIRKSKGEVIKSKLQLFANKQQMKTVNEQIVSNIGK